MSRDMAALRTRYLDAVEQLSEQYEAAAADAREHYVAHTQQLRAAAAERLGLYRDALQRTTRALNAERSKAAAEAAASQQQVAQARHENVQLRERMAAERTELQQQAEVDMTALRAEHAAQLQKAAGEHKSQHVATTARVAELEAALAAATQSGKDVSAQLQATEARLQAADTRVANRDTAIAALESERSRLVTELREALQQCTTQAAAMADLQQQVQAQQHQLQTAQQRQVNAPAVASSTSAAPAVGVAQGTAQVVEAAGNGAAVASMERLGASAPPRASGDLQQPVGTAAASAAAEVVIVVERDGLSGEQVAESLQAAIAASERAAARQDAASREEAAMHRRLADTSARLRENRGAIKAWLSEFEEREGRAAGKEDKKEIRDMYALDRELTNKAEESVADVERSKEATAVAQAALTAARSAVQRLTALRDSIATSSEAAPVSAGPPAADGPQFSALTAQLTAARQDAAKADARAEAAELRVAELEPALEAEVKRVDELRAEVAALQEDAAAASRKAEAAESRAVLLQKRLEIMASDPAGDGSGGGGGGGDGADAHRQREMVALLEGELASARKQVEEATAEADALRTGSEGLKAQLEDEQRRAHSAEERLRKAQEELAAARAAQKEEEAKNQGAPVVVAASVSAGGGGGSGNNDVEVEAAQRRADEAERRAEEAQSRAEEAEVQAQDATAKVDELTERVAELEEELEAAQGAADAAAVDLELAQAKLAQSAASHAAQDNAVAEVLREWVATCESTMVAGRQMWQGGKKKECLALYFRVAKDMLAALPETLPMRGDVEKSYEHAETVRRSKPSRAASTLRKGMEAFVAAATAHMSGSEAAGTHGDSAALAARTAELQAKKAALEESRKSAAASREAGASARAANANTGKEVRTLKKRITDLERKLTAAKQKAEDAERRAADAAASASSSGGGSRGRGGGGDSGLSKTQIKNLKRDAERASKLAGEVKDLKGKLRAAEKEKNDAERRAAAGGKEGAKALATAERKVAEAEKRMAKAVEAARKDSEKATAAAERRTKEVAAERDRLAAELEEVTANRDALAAEAAKVGNLTSEMEELRATAGEAAELRVKLTEAERHLKKLDEEYRKETYLRKKYFNDIQDMMGKIRVYCRVRPISGSEAEKKCQSVVSFPDDMSIDIATSRAVKTFNFDRVFPPGSSQEEVFSDTSFLVQSAFDGYNVCIFAYGQTGSGKTYTMTGYEGFPGITPRAVNLLFEIIEQNSANFRSKVKVYMVELYLDGLVDLLYKVEHKKSRDKPLRLDIKKNKKGMVYIKNVVEKQVTTPEEVLKWFDAGNGARHVGATKMNATSSRSHLIFSIVVESYNLQTKKTSTGKLSLVDLAGSERVGKTGATKDRLKEAMAINKSLSALGNVIYKLSEGAKVIPYRDHKLTMLMQDSLGGNAKTLMFVNISPADYNEEESVVSMQYAQRVKLITNDANKNADSEEVSRLKRIIANLKAGRAANDDDDDDGGDESKS